MLKPLQNRTPQNTVVTGLGVRAWSDLSDATQLMLSRRALAHATELIARQAETLADDMDQGAVAERCGPAALRLLTVIIRMNGQSDAMPRPNA